MKKRLATRICAFLLALTLIIGAAPTAFAALLVPTADLTGRASNYFADKKLHNLETPTQVLAVHNRGSDITTGGWKFTHYTSYDSAVSLTENSARALAELAFGSFPGDILKEIAAKDSGSGNFSTAPRDQIMAMLTLRVTKTAYNETGALSSLIAAQRADGSFAAAGGGSGDIQTTALAVILLRSVGSAAAETAAQRAFSYIVSVGGGGYGTASKTAAAIGAFVAMGRGESDALLTATYNELCTYQNADGSFSELKAGATDDSATALALLYASDLKAGSNLITRMQVSNNQRRVSVEIMTNSVSDPFPTIKENIYVKPFDLLEYGSQMYNSEHPTALHAVITAMDQSGYITTDSARFNFSNGFIEKMNISAGLPYGQSYQYMVNDLAPRGERGKLRPGLYTLKDGDRVTVFMPSKLETNKYTYFDRHEATVATGQALPLTLYGFDLKSHLESSSTVHPDITAVPNAEILIDGRQTQYKTDSAGGTSVSFSKAGKYTVSAQSRDLKGNVNVYPLCRVTVTGETLPTETKTVKMRIEGGKSTLLTADALSVTTDGAPTAFDAAVTALNARNISYTSPAGQYYFTSVGGDRSDGSTTGFTYSVNGKIPSVGMNDYKLKDGDEIVLAYGDFGLRFPQVILPASYTGGDYKLAFTTQKYADGQMKVVPLSSATINVNSSPYLTDAAGEIIVPRSRLNEKNNTIYITSSENSAGVPTVVRQTLYFDAEQQNEVALNSENSTALVGKSPLMLNIAESFNGAAMKLTMGGGDTAEVQLPKITAKRGGAEVRFSKDTRLSAGAGFDGTVALLQQSVPAIAGFDVNAAYLVGSESYKLKTDKAVAITLPKKADSAVGIVVSGTLLPLDKLANDSEAALGGASYGYYETENAVHIYTKQLGKFVLYSEKNVPDASNTVRVFVKGATSVILQPTVVSIAKGESAASVLSKIAALNVKTAGTPGEERITEINGLAEKSAGENSLFVYKVNGNHFNVPAGAYPLKSGDVVEILFSKDGGIDVGCDPKTALNPDGSAPNAVDAAAIKSEISRLLPLLNSNSRDDLSQYFLLLRAGSEVDTAADRTISKMLEAGEYSSTELANIAMIAGILGKDIRNVGGVDLLKKLYTNALVAGESVNAAIYNLIAYDALDVKAPQNVVNSEQKLIAKVLSTQGADGGFALSAGGGSDVDITAMALSALASYRDVAGVKTAIEAGISFLSAKQLDDGSFMGFDSRASESVSQVIIALCQNGISPADARFTKTYGGLMSALLTFKTADGYAHISGGATDAMATSQAASAYVAAREYLNDDSFFDCGRESTRFNDLAGTDYAKDAIEEMDLNGIMTGVGDKAFAPQKKITREQLVKMLVTALCIDVGGTDTGFSDCPKDAWYTPYVAAAKREGIVGGIDVGVFGVGREVSRQDFATILYRAANKLGITLKSGELSFTDNEKIADYATAAVAALAASGIISGRDDGSFDPQATCTRAEAAVMFSRFINL